MLSAEACQVMAVGSIATIICFLTVLAGRRIRAGRSRRSRRSFGVRARKRETSIDIERFPPAVP